MRKSIYNDRNLTKPKDKTVFSHKKELTGGKIGKNIKKIRTQKGLSQQQLAQKSGISQSFLSDLENGKKSPTVDSLNKICRSLGISLAEFFSRGKTQGFAALPAEIINLVDDLRELSPGQIQHLRSFIRSLNNK